MLLNKINNFITSDRVAVGFATIKDIFPPETGPAIVGGLIRELYMASNAKEQNSTESLDIDIAVNLPAEEIAARIAAAGYHPVRINSRFGTVVAEIANVYFEITAYRGKTVSGGDLSTMLVEDLKLRDFTINSIGYLLHSRELIDPTGGILDIANGTLRASGDSITILRDDPLRLLRLVRFGPGEGRKIDSSLQGVIPAVLPGLATVALERIGAELSKIVIVSKVAEAFFFMRDNGFLQHVLPELVPTINFEQNEFHQYELFEHTVRVVEGAEPLLAIRLAALFHDIGKPATLSIDDDGRRHFYLHEVESEKMALTIMERLKYPTDLTEKVCKLVRLHMRPLNCGPSGARRLIRELGDDFKDWFDLKRADNSSTKIESHTWNTVSRSFLDLIAKERAREQISPYSKLAINGDDLLSIGYKEGPSIGTALKQLHEKVLDDPSINTKASLLALAARLK